MRSSGASWLRLTPLSHSKPFQALRSAEAGTAVRWAIVESAFMGSSGFPSCPAGSILSKSAIGLPAILLRHAMTLIAPERMPRPVVFVRLRKIVRRTPEQPRHSGQHRLAHVRRARLLLGIGHVTVNGIAHLRVEPAGPAVVNLPSALAQVEPGQRGHG